MEKLLIVEDDKDIRNVLKQFLEGEGYQIDLAGDGAEALAMFHQNRYDLILLDIMLPKIDGYTVCEVIRNSSDIPVIMLTALGEEEDQVKGFEQMADDYIIKPFSMIVVIKRVEAVLRRYRNAGNEKADILQWRELIIDLERCQVKRAGKDLLLTYKEFELLKLLLSNKGKVLTRERLLDIIWGYDYYGDDKIINSHVKNLRKKLEIDCIETIRGVGYRFVE